MKIIDKKAIQPFLSVLKKDKKNLDSLFHTLIKATDGAINALETEDQIMTRSDVNYSFDSYEANKENKIKTEVFIASQLKSVKKWLHDTRSKFKKKESEDLGHTIDGIKTKLIHDLGAL